MWLFSRLEIKLLFYSSLIKDEGRFFSRTHALGTPSVCFSPLAGCEHVNHNRWNEIIYCLACGSARSTVRYVCIQHWFRNTTKLSDGFWGHHQNGNFGIFISINVQKHCSTHHIEFILAATILPTSSHFNVDLNLSIAYKALELWTIIEFFYTDGEQCISIWNILWNNSLTVY